MDLIQFSTLSIMLLTISYSSTGQEAVSIWEEPLTLPTYEIKPSEKSPMFFNHQSYQGASRYIYPYALQDNISNLKTNKTYKALYLENKYIKLCVLPEIGGRLFYATDKTNGYEMFYRQNVIKPANIGMLGAWISGGIEFCVFHHHRASTNIPVDYHLQQNDDGSATIWIGETELRHRMKWTLGISLYPDKSYLEVDGRLVNPTENINSILYWANVATHVNNDYQIIFPPSTDFAVYHAKNSFVHWPITRTAYLGKEYYENNIDASWWKNHPDPISMFAHELQEGFLAGYDFGKKAGTMHIANRHIVKGAKLWEWGPGAYGAMWDSKVLTDSDGPYAELMTGAYSDNQPDYSWIKPYEYKTFKQYWYPLRNIEGAVSANINATLNVKSLNGNEFLIAANTTQSYQNAKIILQVEDHILFDSIINIAPEAPFDTKVKIPNTLEARLKLSLLDKNRNSLIEYQPVKKKPELTLPDVVTPPANPDEIESLEELYITGLRIKQFHNARIESEIYFREALKRDPMDIRSNTMMGILSKNNFEHQQAAAYFRSALKRSTANYTRPRNCEPFYHLGVILKHQKKLEAAYDTLYRAAWDQDFASAAYFHLAQISVAGNNYGMALSEINRSIDYNNSNLPALNLKTSILRLMDRQNEAKRLTEIVLNKDALNYYAFNERVLLRLNQRTELEHLMRNNPESYLELAVGYLNSGLYQEAKTILTSTLISTKKELREYPTIHYYLGYLFALEGKEQKAIDHFNQGRTMSTDYCFPFRIESITIYYSALKFNPKDSRAHYYLGNLLYDKQPELAIKHWEKAVNLEPTLAIAYRNLGWGYHQTVKDFEKSISAYNQAIIHDNRQAKYYYELDKLYEIYGTPIAIRYQLLTKNHEFVSQRPDALLQEVKVLLLSGQSTKALNYLESNFFPRQEGVDNLHGIYVDACLSQGINELKSKNYEQAIIFFQKADTYPDNHQIARKPNDDRLAQILFFQALAHKGLKNHNDASTLLDAVSELKVGEPIYKYYQALAYKELGNSDQTANLAQEIFEKGKSILSKMDQIDFFAKFGEGQSGSQNEAKGHYLLGLASLLQSDSDEAKPHLSKAYDLNPNDLWIKMMAKDSLSKLLTE